MRLVLVLVAVLGLLVACGSSESDAPKPGMGAGGAGPMAGKKTGASAKSGEEQKQELLARFTWAEGGTPRDRDADATSCSAEIKKDPTLQKGVHPLVKLQHWIQCMEDLGWKMKQG